MTLTDVLTFCQTATSVERVAIMNALGPMSTSSRTEKAAATLSQIKPTEAVRFLYDGVNYKAEVVKINRTTATVKITDIEGTPRRAIFVGNIIRVSAGLLARSL